MPVSISELACAGKNYRIDCNHLTNKDLRLLFSLERDRLPSPDLLCRVRHRQMQTRALRPDRHHHCCLHNHCCLRPSKLIATGKSRFVTGRSKLAGRVTGPRLGQSLVMFFGNHPRSGAYLPVRDDTRESEDLRTQVIGNIVFQDIKNDKIQLCRNIVQNYVLLCN